MAVEKKKLFFAHEESVLGKAEIFVKIALILIIVIMLIISVTQLMKYSELLQKKEELEKKLSTLNDEIDELKYYIESPMSENYVKKFAKELLGLVPADSKVYIAENGD